MPICHPLEGLHLLKRSLLTSGRKITPVGPISRQGHIRVEGDVVPIQIELIMPTKKRDQVTELAFRVSSIGRPIGLVKMRVRLGSGGLPQ
jgi:hypothetical protein